MHPPIAGFHHVTAMCSEPQRNVDFYAGVLGLRLVKRTVNFDDPSSYHLYYGDAAGAPGTLLTFFAWPGARRGRRGVGQVAATALRIPAASVSFWLDRLHAHRVIGVDVGKRDGTTVISLADPDGMRLELVGVPESDDARKEKARIWLGNPVAPEHAIRTLHGVTTELASTAKTVTLLTEVMGLRAVVSEANGRQRFGTENSGDVPSQFIELVAQPHERPGQVAVGFVHHIAWRVKDGETQLAWREFLQSRGYVVSPVMDRTYFHAIYFREPGGVLYEIATDPPGFTADGESVEELGSRLQLPSRFEGQRSSLEKALPPIHLPTVTQASTPFSANE